VRSLPQILLVEDNPDDEALAREALRRSGIANPVVVAHDGAEAVSLLIPSDPHATPLKPGLVLLDLKLPKLSGFDVLRQLRADDRTRGLPVVVLTTSREQRDVVDSYAAGATSYVCKPVDFDEFAYVMRQIAHYWLRLNEPPHGGRH
jgi:CheY-like chemotaxis protein